MEQAIQAMTVVIISGSSGARQSEREGSNYEWDSVQTRVRPFQWPVQLQCLWRLLEGVEWIETGRKTLHAMLRP